MAEMNDGFAPEGADLPSSAGSAPRGPDTDGMEDPDEIISDLTSLCSRRYRKHIDASCKHYGIFLEQDPSRARAKLVLHIVGLTREWLGKAKWEMFAARLSRIYGSAKREGIEALNIQGLKDYPRAWIPCIDTSEAIRQYIKRLTDEHEVMIPTDSQDLCGIEPAQMPTFYLQGCFAHLLSNRKDKLNRFLYIEKALSCWGVYPNSCLFQQIGTVLANILTPTVISHRSARWNKIRVLNALGMGLQLRKNGKGKKTRNAVLQPWGIELQAPYDIDFLLSLWLGHVIGSAMIEGQRRAAETPKLTPPPISTRQESPGEEGLGSGYASPSTTTLNKPSHRVKDPIHHSVPTQKMVTPSPNVGRGGQRRDQPSGLPDSPAITRQVLKLNPMASEEETAVAVMRAGARYQERLDRRAEGDGIRKNRHENARDLQDRVGKQRRARRDLAHLKAADELAGGTVELGGYSQESRSPPNAFTNNAADASRTAGQTPTPSKTPGKRLISPLLQLGEQEQKKVRLSLTATEVNWGNKSIASGIMEHPQAVSHGDIPHQGPWSLQCIISANRGRPHRHRTPRLAQKISIGHDEDENIKDDSDHSALEHSDPPRFSDNKLPGKRVAAQSNAGGNRDPPKRVRLLPRLEGQLELGHGRRECDHMGSAVHDRADEPPTGHQSGAVGAVPSNVGPSTQPLSSEANHLDPKEPQRRSYLSAAWEVLRGLCGRKSHHTPRP